MQRVSEFGAQGSVAGVGANSILSSLRGLICSKYGDVILLCTVTTAFCILLAFSATG